MKQKGEQWTCIRCGEKAFFMHTHFSTKPGGELLDNDDWLDLPDLGVLCPGCKEKLLQLLADFMKGAEQ